MPMNKKNYVFVFILITIGLIISCVLYANYKNEEKKISYTIKAIKIYETEPEPKIVVEPQDISENFDIFTSCGYTSEELSYALSDANHEVFLPYVDAFLKAEKIYNVNALYLISMLGYESGWGRYPAATNNIAGWTDGNGGYREFESVEECILHIAMNLSEVYKEAVGGRLEDICERYCPVNEKYTETLMQIMKEREAVIHSMNA